MYIKGTKGADYLFGTDESDTIKGGRGNDVLDGRNGDDSLRGGKGADTFILSGDQLDFDTIKDFQTGVDTIIVETFEGETVHYTGFGAGLIYTEGEYSTFVGVLTNPHDFTSPTDLISI